MKNLCALDFMLILLIVLLTAWLLYSMSKKEGFASGVRNSEEFMFKSDKIEPRVFLQPCESF